MKGLLHRRAAVTHTQTQSRLAKHCLNDNKLITPLTLASCHAQTFNENHSIQNSYLHLLYYANTK